MVLTADFNEYLFVILNSQTCYS